MVRGQQGGGWKRFAVASLSRFDRKIWYRSPYQEPRQYGYSGQFFSLWEIDAGGYGPNIHEVFLNLQNPAASSKGYKALKAHQGENYAGVSAREDLERAGYDGVNNDSEEFIAFSPEQIKSTSNRGTFTPDKSNINRAIPLAVGAGGLLALTGVKKKNFRYA